MSLVRVSDATPFISATQQFLMRTKVFVERRADMVSYLLSTHDGGRATTPAENMNQQSRADMVLMEDLNCHVCQELLLDPVAVRRMPCKIMCWRPFCCSTASQPIKAVHAASQPRLLMLASDNACTGCSSHRLSQTMLHNSSANIIQSGRKFCPQRCVGARTLLAHQPPAAGQQCSSAVIDMSLICCQLSI